MTKKHYHASVENRTPVAQRVARYNLWLWMMNREASGTWPRPVETLSKNLPQKYRKTLYKMRSQHCSRSEFESGVFRMRFWGVTASLTCVVMFVEASALHFVLCQRGRCCCTSSIIRSRCGDSASIVPSSKSWHFAFLVQKYCTELSADRLVQSGKNSNDTLQLDRVLALSPFNDAFFGWCYSLFASNEMGTWSRIVWVRIWKATALGKRGGTSTRLAGNRAEVRTEYLLDTAFLVFYGIRLYRVLT